MKKVEVGLFIIRFTVGMIFLLHGFDKFQSGLGNIAGWFESVGLPGFLAYVIAVIELLGGLALIAGIGVRVVSILFALTMLGAIFTVKLSAGFLGGYELDVILLAASVQLALTGSNYLAIQPLLTKEKTIEV